MIHPAEPPPPGRAELLRQIALPAAVLLLALALFIRTTLF